MGRKRDSDTGRYTETVGDAEIVGFLKNRNGAGTSEVAEQFGYEQPTAYRRLKSLEEGGEVQSRRIGGSLLWTATEDGGDSG